MAQFRIGSYIFTLNARCTRLEKEVLGIRSNLDKKSIYHNGLHILMFDCDDIPKRHLIKELIELQHEFKLGDAEVYRSSKKTVYYFETSKRFPFIHARKEIKRKWHVYFFQDPMTYWKAFKIIHYATNVLRIVDEAYSRWRGIRPNMVLRLSPKSDGFVPEPLFIVRSPYIKPDVKWFKSEVYRMLQFESDKSAKKV